MKRDEWALPAEGGALRFVAEPLHEWEFEFANLDDDWQPSDGIHDDQRIRVTVFEARQALAQAKAEQLLGPPADGRWFAVRLVRVIEARPGRLTTA